MARIRSIKPEFWSSEQVMECSRNARLLFIGLWNWCDDSGRLPIKLKTIKANIFPGDDLSLLDVQGMLRELSRNGLVMVYTVEEQEYLWVTGWHHQKINHPQPPKYPGPEQDDSSTIPGLLTDHSPLIKDHGKDQGVDHGGEGMRARPPVDGNGALHPVDIVQKTHDQLIEITGADPVKCPAWMSAHVVSGWIQNGASPEIVIEAVRDVMARRGNADPPSSPAYFTKAVLERCEAPGISQAEADRQQRRMRVRGYAMGVLEWNEDWGDTPSAAEQIEAAGKARPEPKPEPAKKPAKPKPKAADQGRDEGDVSKNARA